MATPSRQGLLRPGDLLVVIHDFDARSADELTLRRSERVSLIELDDGFSDGWYLGKHMTTGYTGLFPGVYTTKAPPSLRTPPHSRITSIHAATTISDPRSTPLNGGDPATLAPLHLPNSVSTNVQSTTTPSGPDPEPTGPPPYAQYPSTYVQKTIGEALVEGGQNRDSPVMNETLNSIEEHISDFSTPRQSQAVRRHREDSESDYSTHMDRHSFMSGPETDEEDSHALQEAQVRSWDHNQTAQYLEQSGMDPAHCRIFREQEITGDVLLDMDQSFIYMKEYDFGVMGKRLKTWHKVRDIQREVKASSSKRTSERRHHSSREDVDRTSAANLSTASSLTRLHDRAMASRQSQLPGSIDEEPADMPYPLQLQPQIQAQPQSQPQQASKRASWAAQTPSSSWRAALSSGTSAASDNDRRSRRHSSIDLGPPPDLELSSQLSISSHQKQSSWSMAGSTAQTTPSSSIRPATRLDEPLETPHNSSLAASPLDIDRGYFSSNEIDNQKTRNRLSKSPKPGHVRQSSMAEKSNRTSILRRHGRLSSAGSIQDQSHLGLTGASKAYNQIPIHGRTRSASVRGTSYASSTGGLSPAVTNLENNSVTHLSSPAVEKKRMQDRARKIMGFRAASEAVTQDEKLSASSSSRFTPVLENDFVASPVTGNTTPSATPSIDMDTPEDSIRGSETPGPQTSRNTLRPRPLTKQYTSAYTHGLLKIPPSEARKQCDHHGWMKKKSSGIMTTWKPRLFILRGRRLSYYYSESDTEERGIIDISSHKVLVANDDPMVTLHASVTGAATKPSATPDPSASPSKGNNKAMMNVFYFKLLPPKSGLSRAVQFTKPAVHYFQVDTITEGRKWMGEILKATIEHDLTSFSTTNKQKTISLAKARARNERPPELNDTKKEDIPEEEEGAEDTIRQSGLMIQGLDKEPVPATQTQDAQKLDTEEPTSIPTISLETHSSPLLSKQGFVDTIPEEENKENVNTLDVTPTAPAAQETSARGETTQ